ncbi:probable microtubule-binding protein TANGLED [Arabidopsis lyrata subsp. lyrata]|uniref:probable microtubule-binding protein TANGLED n=1 Tax=Arabidopsis lyrata subsp. lyrata TaxID=81972 RepID=UPI000A29AAC2|nr:probable microtubule-binding protein TANGLED [Arabidopsis lyrata subsp. lyrata]|eukprot:XP_020888111.1 probable microtubule-binding protein TANGLED [Arabidopsis lyrata subsp. lyrata]
MVARTPQKQRKVAMVVPPLNSDLLKETINKVDKCMERLQELQYTIAGGTKVVSGVNLSPRSTRTYLRTSLRCKQETLRIKSATNKKSPVGKFPASSPGDWRKMSLPAMLLGETVNEILQASQVTRDIVEAIAPKKSRKSRRLTMSQEDDGPKTPETERKAREPNQPETVSSNFKARRKKEKQNRRSESDSPPSQQRARSRIAFTTVSPQKIAGKVQGKGNGENSFRHLANRVSPKHKPWVQKAVLFPNPLFISGTATQQAKFSRTMSPVIARNEISSIKNSKETPHNCRRNQICLWCEP